jgi:hypothetical protein
VRIVALMQYTSEARWFFKGELSDAVLDWFLSGARDVRADEAEARTDRYLVFPGCDTVGVKVRDANDRGNSAFEVKALLRGPKVTRLGPRVTARVDEWIKWSSPMDRFPDWTAAILASEPTWVTVEKERRLRTFSLDEGDPVEVDREASPDRGCTIDVVTLATRGEDWWTLGLESSGPAEQVGADLLRTGRQLFDRPEGSRGSSGPAGSAGSAPPELAIVQSLSYATWAAALVAE